MGDADLDARVEEAELAAGWIHVVGYEHTTVGMGPTAVYLLVGKRALIEGGFAAWLVLLLGLAALLLWARWTGRAIPWGARLDENGDPAAP